MRRVSGDWDFDACDEGKLVLDNGSELVEYDGCDWKDNPTNILVKLTTKLNELGEDKHELVEISDGSDTLWFGIINL